MELALSEHLSLRGDYIYTYYPSVSTKSTKVEGISSVFLSADGTYTAMHDSSVQVSNNTVMLGLSYYFN
jgi:opacity protein-like surface antigen